MSKSHGSGKTENNAQRSIRLLGRLERTPAILHSRTEDSIRDLQAFIELLDNKFIEGRVVYDSMGNLTSILGMSITARGRLFLDQLRANERSQKWDGFWHAHRLQVVASSLLLGAAFWLFANW
jgi:hypothetical protein